MPLDLYKKIKKSPNLIFLYLMVLIPILIMCYFLITDYSRLQQETLDRNEQMARMLAENLDAFLENEKTVLKSIGQLPSIQRRHRFGIEAILKSFKSRDNLISLLWVADENGKIIAKYPNSGADKQDKSFIQQAEKSKFISEPHQGTISGVKVITISSLIRDQHGEVKGIAGASIPLEKLRQKLLLKIGQTGFPILVTKSGNFLVYPKNEESSKKISPNDPVFQAISRGDSGTLDMVDPFDSQRKFYSYFPLLQADWIVLVVQPVSEFHAKTYAFFSRNVVVIILALFLVILAAYYLRLSIDREEEHRALQAEKLAIVGQLAAGMAHEIRNPLTSIKGFAQLAASRGNALTPEQLKIIMEETDRIEGIVKETLMLAKPAPIEFKPVSLPQLLGEVQVLMEPQLNMKGVELIITAAPGLPVIVAEPNHLKQVLINLIKNSVEASPATGGQIYIDIKLENNRIVLVTRDNGCGIPPDILRNLGSPFVSTKETGTGLGLTVSFKIIQNHGGKMTVSSAVGKGTTFTIQLPVNGTT